jgi:hypothetical protein
MVGMKVKVPLSEGSVTGGQEIQMMAQEEEIKHSLFHFINVSHLLNKAELVLILMK